MSFKSSKGRDTGKELEVYRSTSKGQGIGGGGGGVAAPGSISGGNVDDLEPGNGYHYHTFTGPGDAVVSGGDVKATIFMIGGGGGGGGFHGGGGGAGGAVLYSVTLEPGTYPITIGAGGAGSSGENSSGSNGSDTTFGPSTPLSITAKGGGAGAVGDRGPGPGRIGKAGGCGGGGGTQPYAGGSENQTPQNPTLQVKHGFIQFGTPGGSSATSPSADHAGGGGGTGGSEGVGRYKHSPINAPNGTDGMQGGDGKLFQGFTGPLTWPSKWIFWRRRRWKSKHWFSNR